MFYIYSEEVIKLNGRLDAIAVDATAAADSTTYLVNDDEIKYISNAISIAEESERVSE